MEKSSVLMDFDPAKHTPIYRGKAKDVYERPSRLGRLILRYGDDLTVNAKGEVDPGGNVVGDRLPGFGKLSLELTLKIMERCKQYGINNAILSADTERGLIEVMNLKPFGLRGLEMVGRRFPEGSMLQKWPGYFTKGQVLTDYVEITDKSDKDYIMSKSLLTRHTVPPIMSENELKMVRGLTLSVMNILADFLMEYQLILIDFKAEFARHPDGGIVLIDTLDVSSLRAFPAEFKTDDAAEQSKMILGDSSYALPIDTKQRMLVLTNILLGRDSLENYRRH